MTAEETELFAKSILKDIKENTVTYVGDKNDKMCSVGNACKVIISYDNTGAVISILGIKRGVFHRMFATSPLKEYVTEMEKLCTEKGIDENAPMNKKNPRTR